MAEHCLTKLLVVGFVSLLSLAVRADDLIWYQPDNGYTGHQYAWRGTTGGNSAPELLIASFVNQPWLVTISKTKNVIYWADNRGILGTWNVSSKQQGLVYQFNIGNWDENSNGPALTGLDLDELNNHLYFTFNRSIYRLDLSQTTPAPSLIASYPNLVFNPRYSASHNSLYFCIRNNFNEQGDLVQVSLSDPSTMTTLVYNTSTGSIVQQLYIDDTTNTLYYNSPGTLTMRGVSLAAPYPQVFQSIYLGTNPTFFDFNPTTKAFVFSDLRFNRASLWPLGQGAPTTIYQPPYGRVTGVKFYNDTHALVAFQYPSAGQGYLSLVNVKNFNDTSVLVQHFGLGKSLIFDEKKCDFYYVLSQQFSGQTYQSVMRKNIRDQEPSLYANEITTSVNGMMGGIALDVSKRNLIVSSALNGFNTIAYFLIDNPNASPVQIIDSKGRSISNYVVNDKTGDIFYNSNTYIYRLDATSISKDWINNVGRQIIGPISTLYSVKMAVDSVGKKFYYSVDSSIMQSNFDGSDIKTFYTVPGKQSAIRSMKWDPSSKRLYFIAVPQSGWIMASINDDGANLISAPLNASSSSSQDLFSHISPDPHSEWVYMKAKYYQPLRISKDGSQVEILNLYSPLHYQVGSMAFDETTGSIYYNDDQCVIKKINISNVNLDDPNTTPFAVAWKGDSDKCSDVSFVHDRANRQLWLLQSNQGTNYSVAVTPVNGGPTKQLFAFPKNFNPPFAIDTTSSKMFAFYFTLDRRGYPVDQSLVTMDLYNGSNMRIVKKFDRMTMTAVTFDTRTNMVYYGLDSYGETVLECFDPVTLTAKRLWYLPNKRYFIRDLKVKDGSVYMAMYYGNIFVYDLKNGTATDQLAYATALSLNPSNNDIYFAPPYAISSANVQSINATQMTILKAFTIDDLVFDFDSRSAYFSISISTIRTEPPYYYRMDLDGSNKKRIQLQRSFYVPAVLKQLSLVNGKFYAANGYLDSFNMDGTGYNRIMQSTSVRGDVQYDEGSQRVYWQENYGQRLYSCAVYSNIYADCQGYQLFSEMQYTSLDMPQLRSFVIGKNSMIYFTAFYQKAIFQMNLDIGVSSMKILVSDPRLAYVSGITTDKLKSALFVTTAYPTISPAILRIGFDGTITTLYSNVPLSESILSTDLTHCIN